MKIKIKKILPITSLRYLQEVYQVYVWSTCGNRSNTALNVSKRDTTQQLVVLFTRPFATDIIPVVVPVCVHGFWIIVNLLLIMMQLIKIHVHKQLPQQIICTVYLT